jgi:hypothetical protein
MGQEWVCIRAGMPISVPRIQANRNILHTRLICENGNNYKSYSHRLMSFSREVLLLLFHSKMLELHNNIRSRYTLSLTLL